MNKFELENMSTADLSTGATAKLTTLDMFTTKRVVGEKDLVAQISKDLISLYHKDASPLFLNDTDISLVSDLNPLSQRIIINRWFINALLIYRANSNDVEVSEILLYAINDGTIDEWLELIERVVIPFFKNKNILKISI